ncbi:thermonuclease family protein [Campylobacter hepaticus]
MRINYKKLLNLRKILSDPKKFFSILIFILVMIFIQNFMIQTSSFEAKVLKVIDGDTIEVKQDNKIFRVRLFGIDAPELKQNFGNQAREALNKIVKGKQVKIIYENKDIYDRIVAIVKLNDKDVNQFLVSQGYAWADVYYSGFYIKEQEYAKKNRLGLWKQKNPIEPYKWRKHNKF